MNNLELIVLFLRVHCRQTVRSFFKLKLLILSFHILVQMSVYWSKNQLTRFSSKAAGCFLHFWKATLTKPCKATKETTEIDFYLDTPKILLSSNAVVWAKVTYFDSNVILLSRWWRISPSTMCWSTFLTRYLTVSSPFCQAFGPFFNSLHGGSFRKIMAHFWAIFWNLKKAKRSKNGSKMTQKGQKKGKKGLRQVQKYNHDTFKTGPKIVKWNSPNMPWKWAILLQNEHCALFDLYFTHFKLVSYPFHTRFIPVLRPFQPVLYPFWTPFRPFYLPFPSLL